VSTTSELVERLKSLADVIPLRTPNAYTAGDIDVLFYAAASLQKIDELERENARMRAALEPFVKWHRIRETQGGMTGAPNHPDDTPIFMAASTAGEQYITLGDLRRAAALAGSGEK
jgi:hypothetical protein